MIRTILGLQFAATFLATANAWGAVNGAIGGSIVDLQISGTESITLGPAAQISYFRAYNQSRADIDGATVSWSRLYENSQANVLDHSNVSWLLLYDNSTANIYGGDVGWLKLHASSQAHVKSLDSLGWLLLNDQSEAHLYGTDFEYSNGILSGKWIDGAPFSVWALNEPDLRDPLSDRSNLPAGVKLHVIPEPATPALALGLASGLIGWRRQRSRSNAG
jgi:hypothetical protein